MIYSKDSLLPVFNNIVLPGISCSGITPVQKLITYKVTCMCVRACRSHSNHNKLIFVCRSVSTASHTEITGEFFNFFLPSFYSISASSLANKIPWSVFSCLNLLYGLYSQHFLPESEGLFKVFDIWFLSQIANPVLKFRDDVFSS